MTATRDRVGGGAVDSGEHEAQIETTSPVSATVAQVANMIRIYWEGLGDTMPEPLKETLTKEFAAQINEAMGVSIAKHRSERGKA